MSGPNDWNPEDGPPPTEDELREAAELEHALAAKIAPNNSSAQAKSSSLSEGTLALVETAMRAHATTHPAPTAQVQAAVSSAVSHATARRGGVLSSRRWFVRVTAAAAVLVAGVIGGRAITQRGATHASGAAPITRSADDVFNAALGNDPGSDPISRIESSRMRDYRSTLFARGGRAR
ncbi:MAG: hypothetical protein U0269_03935 [Polyangiales bacterium]